MTYFVVKIMIFGYKNWLHSAEKVALQDFPLKEMTAIYDF